MSKQVRRLTRGLTMLVAAGTIALAVPGAARAWDNHRHHGSDAFLSFGFSAAPYYYDPYPYGPAYAYPPAYAYGPPPYAYGGGGTAPYAYGGGGYDQEPNYDYGYESGPYSDSGSGNGPNCREFQTTVVIDGQPQSAHGTACQQPDGSWAVVH